MMSSCLLVSQDRDQISVVIGEWDKFYEYYAVEGRLPTPKPTAVARTSHPIREAEVKSQVPAPETPVRGEGTKKKVQGLFQRNPAKTVKKNPKQKATGRSSPNDASGSERDNYGVDADIQPGPDQGFMKLNVYGPFNTHDRNEMNSLSHYLLAMSMCLARVPEQTLESEDLLPSRPSSRGRARRDSPPDAQQPPEQRGHRGPSQPPGPNRPSTPSATGPTGSNPSGKQASGFSSTRAVPGQQTPSSRPTKVSPPRERSRSRPAPVNSISQVQPHSQKAQDHGHAAPTTTHQRPVLATPPASSAKPQSHSTDPRALRPAQQQPRQPPTTQPGALGAGQDRSPAAGVHSQGAGREGRGVEGGRTTTEPTLRPNRSEGNLRAGYTLPAEKMPPLPTNWRRDQAVAREGVRHNNCAQVRPGEVKRMPQSPIAA